MNYRGRMYVLLVVTLFLNLLTVIGLAQTNGIISGKVIDGATGNPLPYAHVFFNNTSTVAVTDSLGRFRLVASRLTRHEVVASSIGYKTLHVLIDLAKKSQVVTEFRMIPEASFLNEVVVTSRNRKKFNKDLNFFKTIFLGTSENAQDCEILNPEVLSFSSSKMIIEGLSSTEAYHIQQSTRVLTATASAPLEVANHALGYRLFVSLEQFSGSEAQYQMKISARFDTLAARNEKERERWWTNRVRTYQGSPAHFFHSLRDGRSADEGFRIRKLKSIEEINQPISKSDLSEVKQVPLSLTFDSTADHFSVLKKGIYEVSFLNKVIRKNLRQQGDLPYPISWIEAIDSNLYVDSYGIVAPGSDFWRLGYFSTLRVADLLPMDYRPEPTDELLQLAAEEWATLRGVVVDKQNQPLEGAHVFVNNGLKQTTTNKLGHFQLTKIPPGKYTIGFYYGRKKTQTVDAVVRADSTAFITARLEDANPMNYGHQLSANDPHFVQLEKLLLQNVDFQTGAGEFRITNPLVLRFLPGKNQMTVHATAPLIIENKKLGYRWTYYLNEAILYIKKNKFISLGLIRMDTLGAATFTQLRQQVGRQYDTYEGSVNHFLASLVAGRIKEEGFRLYQLEQPISGRVRFNKIVGQELIEVPADSLLSTKDRQIYMTIPAGLEYHYLLKSTRTKFYRGYKHPVVRLQSEMPGIIVSRDGAVAQGDVQALGLDAYHLPRVPSDYVEPANSTIKRNVLITAQSANVSRFNQLREKVYLHLDRPYFQAGDTIWMKAYMHYANAAYADTLSKVLYVELVDCSNRVLAERTLRIENSVASGEIILSSAVVKGDYFIRAYTQWMKNFEDYFTTSLPILSRSEFIPPGMAIDTLYRSARNLDVFLDMYPDPNNNELIQADLRITQDGLPVEANCSISVTDELMTPVFNGQPTIASLREPFPELKNPILRISHALECGITFRGQLHSDLHTSTSEPEKNIVVPKTSNELRTIQTIFLSPTRIYTTQTQGDDFILQYNFQDTATVVLRATDPQGKELGLTMDAQDTAFHFRLPEKLTYSLVQRKTDSIRYFRERNTRLLEEVVVRAKKVIPERQVTYTERRFGPMTQLFEGRILKPVRTNQNLLAFLRTSISGFGNTARAIELAQSPAGAAINSGLFALFFEIWVDGFPISYTDFYKIPFQYVSRIEVFRVVTGVDIIPKVCIYTDMTVPYQEYFHRYKIRGYDRVIKFPTDARGSLSSTVFWDANAQTDTNGSATIRFKPQETHTKIVIEGRTVSGDVFRVVRRVPDPRNRDKE